MTIAESTHQITVGNGTVSAILTPATGVAQGCYVFAHGAGAGMSHPFMAAVAHRLSARQIACLRYNFPYMEGKRGRVDAPAVAWAAVRGAVAQAAELCPGVPLIAGGKSFGGRMTSQAQSEQPLAGVRGLAFFGFPLHPPGKIGTERADHLRRVTIPMLFLQGTKDEFAQLELLQQVVAGLQPLATLALTEGGNHSFGVPKSAGRTAGAVQDDLCDTLATWASNL